jgi:hypothetical protein
MYKGTRAVDLIPLEIFSFGSIKTSGIMIARSTTRMITMSAMSKHLNRVDLRPVVSLGGAIVSKHYKSVEVGWLRLAISVLVNQTEICALLYIRYELIVPSVRDIT